MRIVGEWRLFSDGVTRPVVTAEMAGADGKAVSVRFLIDSGADCTALNAAILAELGLPHQRSPSDTRVRGLTGETDYVTVQSRIEFKRDDGGVAGVRANRFRLGFPGLGSDSLPDRCSTLWPVSEWPTLSPSEKASFQKQGGWARFDAAGWGPNGPTTKF